jgi:Kef-type K+ transport system membrane component KefB
MPVELILLNVGLQAGIITPRFFTMMVVMAVVTTLMTAPLFDFAQRKKRAE